MEKSLASEADNTFRGRRGDGERKHKERKGRRLKEEEEEVRKRGVVKEDGRRRAAMPMLLFILATLCSDGGRRGDEILEIKRMTLRTLLQALDLVGWA